MIHSFKATPVARACAAVIAAGALAAFAPTLYAATAAGTQIKNLATVTYEDAAGNTYSAQSNEAVVTVAQVYSATIGVDVDTTAGAGQTVYLPYVLSNTGNGADTFSVSAVDGITGNDDIDAAGITVYLDSNGNGVPDAGESAISELALQADETVNLVVGVQVPGNAAAGNTLGITLTAEAQEGTGAAVAQSVADLTANQGRDGANGTNESLITVSADAVLATTKTSVHDVANNQITYTIEVKNNGSRSADNVVLFDALPAGTTLVSSSVSGLLASNGDVTNTSGVLSERTFNRDFNADGDADDTDEASFGLDLNNDGDLADSDLDGVYAVDVELPAQTTVSMTFTVSYDPAELGGGYLIRNQGHAAGDTNQDGTANSLVSSNVTIDTVGGAYAVSISDTGVPGVPGANDGGDDDETLNDDQFVDTAAAGGTVLFSHVVSNQGNADDIFELTLDPGNFPAGTVFTFFDESGLVQLTDTNGAGVDTGVIAPGESKSIVLKASLPADAASPPAGTEYEAILTATSAGDPAAAAASDTTRASLLDVVTATADLHNAPDGTLGTDEDPLGAPDYAATTTFQGASGQTVTIPLYIDNESGSADSYTLAAGASWDGSVLGALPSGWTVAFFATDGAGNKTGNAISNTAVIAASALNTLIIAEVTIPDDGTLAVDDLQFDNDADGTDESIDGNGDGDGDYPVFFRISSTNTGATDVKLDAIDVDATRQLSLVTPGSNQVNPGGTVGYGHTLANNGNVAEVIELVSSNNAQGFTHTVSLDTDGDGVADTAVDSLPLGTITVQQGDGTDVTVTVTDDDGDGLRELTLEPGFSLPLSVTVFAPSNAAPGTIDTLTLSAENVDADAGAPSAQVTDQTTVINGQVRLVKTAAADADCDGEPDGAFAQIQTTEVAPGSCAIWQVVASNQGAADAQNVTITDAVTAFSSYEPDSLQYCLSSSCAPATVTDGAGDDAGTLTGNTITFFVGADANPGAGEGGTLVPGESATARFSVRVQ